MQEQIELPRTSDDRPILSQALLDEVDPSPISAAHGRYRYFCPIHGSDKQRSLSVDPDTGQYYCHACKAGGILREFWTGEGRTPVTLEEQGRRVIERQRRTDEARIERLAAPLPEEAAAFLSTLDGMNAALRDPNCPGHQYLQQRGLDPVLAADLGAGYAEPNTWPGDHGRKHGRIVYPMTNPMTGAIISAVGRLCVDPSPDWTDERRDAFKTVKQRKLVGCPAGVWPRLPDVGSPLVLVEGPADALALLQHGLSGVVALIGTSNVIPTGCLKGYPSVVVALDGDDSGQRASRAVRVEMALVGVKAVAMRRDWLGDAKDLGELLARGGDVTGAVHAIREAVPGHTKDTAQPADETCPDEDGLLLREARAAMADIWDSDALGRFYTRRVNKAESNPEIDALLTACKEQYARIWEKRDLARSAS